MSTEATPGSTPLDPAAQAAHDAQTAPSAAAAAAAVDTVAPADPVAMAAKHHDDLIGDLRRELSDLKDKNLRLLADMENLRRRTEDEKTSSARYAITRFATDIITVGDNFNRAMSAVPAGAADADPALKSLLEGVEMIEREYLNVLDRHGVKRIAAKGEIFSPHLHQAMMQVPNVDVPAGTILQVFQDGYTIGDRLLRAAVVTVAEGGPKADAKAAAAKAEAKAAMAAEIGAAADKMEPGEPKGT
jgi:molecular chaperone GrpE